MSVAATPGICAKLEEVATRQPDSPAVLAPDLDLPFGKLVRLVRCYAARLVAEGIRPGDIVSLASGDTIAAVSSVFALDLVGAIYIPYSADMQKPGGVVPTITAFLRTPEAPAVPGERNLVIDNTWSPRFATDDGSRTLFPPPRSREGTTWILPSSGTTGRTKHVEISFDLLERRLRTIAADHGVGATRLLQLFHPSTRAFMIRAIAALTTGNTLVEPGPLEFVHRAGVNLVCGSPQQVRLWLPPGPISPRLAKLQISGAKLPETLIGQLLNSFDVVEDVYGSNETIKSHVNVYSRSETGITVRGLPGSGVRIVAPDGADCPAGTAGYVRVRTEGMVHSYVGDPGASAVHFRDGWFYPGDLGVLGDNNVLTIVGRTSDVVNIEGDKIFLDEIEECLASVPGVAAASCFEIASRSGEVRIAACLCVDAAPEVAAAARKACVDRFGPLAAPTAILVVPDLERTADGVIRRGAARDLFDRTVASYDLASATFRLFSFGDHR